ncbi:MAG: hypothetical protein J0M29_17745 [Chitinophagales bacterium]|nr:hypothetical protein [Chitinophagales bacterium]
MKRTLCIVALFTLIGLNLHAQRTATWKGGTPGRSNVWNCPTNWKEGRVPDEFTHVIIPDVSTSTFSYPSIKNATIVVASLYCMPGAKLRLRANARLVELDNPGCKPTKSRAKWAESNGKSDTAVSMLHHTSGH